MLIQLFQHSKDLRFRLLAILILVLINAVMAVFSISLIMPISNSVLDGDGDGWITDRLPSFLQGDVRIMLLVLAGLLMLKFSTSVASVTLLLFTTENLRLKWKKDLSTRYLKQPYSCVASERQGRAVNDLITETDIASGFIFNYLTYLSQIIILVCVFGLLMFVNWIWFSVIIIICALLWFIIGKPYFLYAKKLGKKSVELNQELNAVLYETLSGLKDIKIFHSEDFRLDKIHDVATKNTANRKYKRLGQNLPTFGRELIAAMAVVAVAAFLPSDIDELKRIMPQIVLFLVAFMQIASSLSTVTSLRFKVTSKFPSFLLVSRLLDNSVLKHEDFNKGEHISDFKSEIEFKDVHFSYDGSALLEGINMNIPKGKIVCLIGPSGSGKTTLFDLMARLYDPSNGNIFVDGKDIASLNLADWRGLIGYVPQDPIIYFGTIRENMTLGRDDISDQDLWAACRSAGISDFIEGMENKLSCVLSEKGANLSGGQKKRIALARAIAQKSKIIIMDETTGAVQEDAEREIVDNIKTLPDLTVIIISHRHSTAAIADICYNLSDGKIEYSQHEKK